MSTYIPNRISFFTRNKKQNSKSEPSSAEFQLEKKQLLAVNLVTHGDFEAPVEVAGLQLDSEVAGWNAFGEQAADRQLDVVSNFS